MCIRDSTLLSDTSLGQLIDNGQLAVTGAGGAQAAHSSAEPV